MLGQGVFGGRDRAHPTEVAVHITQDDSGKLVGVVVPPGSRTDPASGDLPTGEGLVCRPADLAINDGIRKAQLLQAPLVIVDPYGVWDPRWGELRSH
jgi:hypothetical protein